MNHATPSTSQTNTKCPLAVDTGDVFERIMRPRQLTSWEQVREAIDLLQKMTWTHYVVRESRLSKEKPEIRYEYVVYVCSFGHKKKPEGHGQRVKGSKFSGCKAMFRLRYDVNRFVISSSRMMHNHPCDEKCLKNDPWFRRLNEDQLKVVRPMVETGSNANSIVKYAEYHFGKTITVPYVNNLKYKVVKRKLIPYIYGILDCGSLNDVIATLRDSGKVFVSYGGVANQVTKIAFSTHEQIETYKRFPEVVCLDSIYNTNRGNYKLFQLVCTDNCGHGVPVMFAWTKEEKKDDVVWILDHFKKIMNGTSQTETFVMDCTRSIISAVELTHRTAHIALCSFHVCRAMCKKTRNPIIKRYLCQLVREQTVVRFHQIRRIISVRSRRIAAYLNKNWMSRKGTWAAAFNSKVVTLGNNTNHRVESAHRQLRRKLSNGDALSKCMWKTFTWQRQLGKRRLLQSSLHCSRKRRYVAEDCLMPLLSRLTTYAGSIVLKDYKKTGLMYMKNSQSPFMFFVDGPLCPVVHISNGTCTCRLFKTCRIPCKHMVFTHLQMPEFTGMLCSSLYHEVVDLVLTLCCRWTWTACGDVDVNIPAISSPDYTETNRLYRILCSKIHTLSTLFEQTTVQDILRQLIDQVDELIRMRCLPTDSEHNTQ
ncbi:unnamed protein product [Schistosoma margrebowiei]|uniref:SWIM-type domain-containing protein n=1 Tax=Schistosoma margrebowiei TaxID=48269 RepID=A0AA84ZKU3_9TREM|nr:unnamed protein product [Schistosoma margrebowiei]